MAWKVLGQEIGVTRITDIDQTTARHPLGHRVKAQDPDYGVGEFIYLKGVASTAAKSWVTYNADDWTTALSAANARAPVAVAMAANTTASGYAWYQIYGKALGKCLTQFADNGRVYLTATAGSVDDASVAGDVIYNATGASTTTADSGYAEFELAYPFCADRVSIIS